MAVALLVAACLMGGALLGLALQSALPAHHLSAESKDVVRLAGGVTASVAALVLGLLIASVSGSFNTQSQEVQTAAARVIQLDNLLALYGPEAGQARDLLRRAAGTAVAQIWHEDVPQAGPQHSFRLSGTASGVLGALHALPPGNDVQQALKAQALAAASELTQT